MENYQGDLTDIVRASGGQFGLYNNSASAASDIINTSSPTWDFSSDPFCSSIDDHHRDNNNLFGDPFSNMRDPLLHELNMPANSSVYNPPNMAAAAANSNGNLSPHHRLQRGYLEDEMKNPSNIFSRIQISSSSSPSSSSSSSQTHNKLVSPCDSSVMVAAVAASPRGVKAPAMVASDMIKANSSTKNCLLVDNITGPGQISSPRSLGIKRRKSQLKKVVCIPAPAAANSRSSGEVVPSDLWAWRKYGQKPIKGSPYPRGYYRCSSSKGCSARKQVERSRTDPNMLVITYTSEHNHPWPTQRNALAGSTRSQPSKANASSKGSVISLLSSCQSHQNSTNNNNNKTKEEAVEEEEEQKESSNNSACVKEEIGEIEKPNDNDDDDGDDDDQMESVDEFNKGFCDFQTYKPELPEPNQFHEDFFAELGEIEADPLDILFSKDFSTTGGGHENKQTRGFDPFNIFDWSRETRP